MRAMSWCVSGSTVCGFNVEVVPVLVLLLLLLLLFHKYNNQR
jgi:hypothetical protein